jgi:hypothetical protein
VQEAPSKTTTWTNHNDDNDGEAGGSSVRCISTVVHSNECQARPPMDHFMRILAETWPNNAYPVKHNLKDYGMMSGFMTSGSLSKGTELIEDPGGSDTTPLFRENIVMMVYGGPPTKEVPCV